MTAIYVICAVLLLLLLLLLIRIKLYIIYYGKNLIIKPCVLGMSLNIPILGTEDFEIPIKEKQDKKPKKAKKSKKGKGLKLKRDFKLKDLKYVLTTVKSLVTRLFTRFKGYLRLERYILKINLATDDPAKTALLYGGLSGVVGSLHALAEGARRRSPKASDIYTEYKPDFYGDKTDIELEIGFSLRLGEILHCGLIALLHALKLLWYFIINFIWPPKREHKKTKGDTDDERILS